MTDEQIKQRFKETYPDYVLGEEPLSPYFDIWEYAFEIATNELQGQIEEMKCCSNCSKVYVRKKDGLVCCSSGSFHINADGKGCKEWELVNDKGTK